VPVQTPTELCDKSPAVRVSNTRSGYLINLVTEATGCGSLHSPWLIAAELGQIIRLTLYDFSLVGAAYVRSQQNSQYPTSSADHSRPIRPYAYVREALNGRNLTIYGGMQNRKTSVFASLSNVVEVSILTSDDVIEVAYFMLKYQGTHHVQYLGILEYLFRCSIM